MADKTVQTGLWREGLWHKGLWPAVILAAALVLWWVQPRGGSLGDTEEEAKAAAVTPSAGPQVTVAVRPVEARPVETELWVPGTLVSRHDAAVSAEVAGPLVSAAEVGDVVEKGGILARVDVAALELQRRADQAEIQRLQARVDYLDKQLARLEALTAEQITAAHQLDELTSQRAMALQDLEGARVDLATTEFRIERSTLRAPFGGQVVARLAQPGAYVAVGQPVVRLVDTAHVEVRAQAPLHAAAVVAAGQELDVEAGNVRRVGTVRAAVPVGDERSRMFEIRVVLEPSSSRTGAGADAQWPVGTPVRVALLGAGSEPTEATGRLAVPRDALVLRRDATYVVVVEDGEGQEKVARRVEVVPGAGRGDLLDVQVQGDPGALAAGDQVVVRGAERLQDGQTVRIAD